MDAVVFAPKALVGRTITGPVALRLQDGRIAEVRRDACEPVVGEVPVEVCAGGLLTPGLVDIQINGAFGVDFANVDAAAMSTIARRLPSTGVTRFLPTLITAGLDTMLGQARAVLAAAADLADAPSAGAVPLGIHLEGPFLSPRRHGVHDPALMVEPTPERVSQLLDAADVLPSLRMVTVAPELPGGTALVRRFADAGVLTSVGHSDATADEVKAAGDAGARMITHLFNAQRGLGHREPGVVGAGLLDSRFNLGLIADLGHVTPDVCKLVFMVAGDRVVLVTDAMTAAGMAPGRYRFAGADVMLGDDGLPRAVGGTLAGSALTLDQAVRNIVSLGVDPAVALTSATLVPADTIGEPSLGRIAPGAVADLVLWGDDLRPRKVWVAGQVVFDAAVPAAADGSTPVASATAFE